MRSLLKTSTGLFLAAVLLAWTSLCGAGVITRCAGDEHDSCKVGVIHLHLDGAPDTEAPAPGVPASGHDGDCGCPVDHEHVALSTEMLPLHDIVVLPPVCAELFSCPAPPVYTLVSLEIQPLEIPPGQVMPGPPPPHLVCGPMLI